MRTRESVEGQVNATIREDGDCYVIYRKLKFNAGVKVESIVGTRAGLIDKLWELEKTMDPTFGIDIQVWFFDDQPPSPEFDMVLAAHFLERAAEALAIREREPKYLPVKNMGETLRELLKNG